ncbi:MAG: hypothetical protein ABFD60_07865 [Bryobacteraceae bacterium]
MKCIECEFFETASTQSFERARGFCHRFPPVHTFGEVAKPPIVSPDNWCGEYREKQKKAAKA